MLDVMRFMSPLRELVGVFEYFRSDEVVTRLDSIADRVYFQAQLIELHTEGSQGLSDHWAEFYPAYCRLVSEFARNWARDRIHQVRARYRAEPRAAHRDEVERALKEIEDDIPNWKYPSED